MLGFAQFLLAQKNYGQESRIDKDDFPSTSYLLIKDYLKDAKRTRFYQKKDSNKKSYEAKFKKGRLHYSAEFDEEGNLKDVEFKITEKDIPNDTWSTILHYLDENYDKYSVKKIMQQYTNVEDQPIAQTLHNAFQNLILPEVNYKLIFTAKEHKKTQNYKALFNAEGRPIQIR